MTREELILMKNKTELLLDGEYIEAREIKAVEKPLDLIRPLWNKELREWQEGMTKEELMTERKNKILHEFLTTLHTFNLERKYDPPTSGNKPRAVSGMARRERSVATRN